MMEELRPPKTPDPLPSRQPTAGASSRVLLTLLVAAILVQNIVWPIVLRSEDDDWPAVAAIVALGIAFGQLSLAAVLLLFGTRYLLARGLVALVMFLGAGFMGARAVEQEKVGVWMGIMLLVLAIIAAPLAIARLAGMVVLAPDEGIAPRGSRQFTIWGLLSLTTLVAIGLGIARLLNFPWEELGGVALFTLALGAIPWTLAPLALSRVPVLGSVLAAGIVCPITGAVIAHTGFPPNEPAELAAMCLVQGAVIVAACAIVRVAGYRLTGPWERQ